MHDIFWHHFRLIICCVVFRETQHRQNRNFGMFLRQLFWWFVAWPIKNQRASEPWFQIFWKFELAKACDVLLGRLAQSILLFNPDHYLPNFHKSCKPGALMVLHQSTLEADMDDATFQTLESLFAAPWYWPGGSKYSMATLQRTSWDWRQQSLVSASCSWWRSTLTTSPDGLSVCHNDGGRLLLSDGYCGRYFDKIYALFNIDRSRQNHQLVSIFCVPLVWLLFSSSARLHNTSHVFLVGIIVQMLQSELATNIQNQNIVVVTCSAITAGMLMLFLDWKIQPSKFLVLRIAIYGGILLAIWSPTPGEIPSGEMRESLRDTWRPRERDGLKILFLEMMRCWSLCYFWAMNQTTMQPQGGIQSTRLVTQVVATHLA